MPITQDKAPQNLPDKAKEIWTSAFNSAYEGTCKDSENRDECSAKVAWSAVKRGFKKDGDTWVPKSVQNLSLYISKASFNKTAVDPNQRMRWFAVASDTDPDSYEDSMSLELYSDFINRIESKELPPEKHRSEYWSGGMPYLSISHYSDQNGKAVPGTVEKIYVDGKCLKASGYFFDNEIGRACFNSVCDDLYSEKKSDLDRVRISIAFIDWAHRHKSNGYEFVRQDIGEICQECVKELLLNNGEGLEFLRGHLIHLALTRVPVNKRTIIMQEEQMTTQVEDAESIVGEEKAQEFEKAKADVAKSESMVVKAETEETEEEVQVAEIVEDEIVQETEEPEVEKSISVHVLEPAWNKFRSAYDNVSGSTYKEKLVAIQGAFDEFGESVKLSFAPTPKEVEANAIEELKSMIVSQSEQLRSLIQEIEILKQKGLDNKPQTVEEVRRSISLDTSQLFSPAPRQGPMSLRDVVNANTY